MRAVRHFGIVVSDMGRALRFYRDLLGLTVVRVMDEFGEHIDNMLSLRNVRVSTVKLSADDGSALVELLEFKSHHDDRTAKRDLYRTGPSHVAFTVDDLEAVCRRLSAAGVRCNAPPQLSPDGSVKVTFVRDPDNALVELVEVLKPTASRFPGASDQT